MPSKEHDRGVGVARRWLRGEGYELRTLPTINGHVPDVYGEMPLPGNKVRRALVEVETGDSDLNHATNQMGAFRAWSDEHGSRRAILLVPQGVGGDARASLAEYDEYLVY